MGKVHGKRSAPHSHKCVSFQNGSYRISWAVDFYVHSGRIRSPKVYMRITDEKNAKRFCRKWKLKMPEVPS